MACNVQSYCRLAQTLEPDTVSLCIPLVPIPLDAAADQAQPTLLLSDNSIKVKKNNHNDCVFLCIFCRLATQTGAHSLISYINLPLGQGLPLALKGNMMGWVLVYQHVDNITEKVMWDSMLCSSIHLPIRARHSCGDVPLPVSRESGTDIPRIELVST